MSFNLLANLLNMIPSIIVLLITHFGWLGIILALHICSISSSLNFVTLVIVLKRIIYQKFNQFIYNLNLYKMEKQNEKSTLVYCVVRYGQIIGCYANLSDAVQIQTTSIQKGQICDLIVKPLL